MIFKKIFRNENGVSEVVGAMLILLILIIYLGVIQAYEVPKWNKELERGSFDQVYSDFLDFRSNLEDVSIRNIPKTSAMHMGVRYPERFMLRNPGQGSTGIITTYPINISLEYNGIIKNYTSMGIVYKMNGISDFPKLVYENGIVIKDYGSFSYSDDYNHLITNESIFVPLLLGIEPITSMEMKTLNIFPIPLQYYSSSQFSVMNMTIETRYPQIWANMSNASKPSGSSFNVDSINRSIKIKNIYGYNEFPVILPNVMQLPSNIAYVGMIPFANKNLIGSSGITQGGSVNCGDNGKEVSKKDDGCIDIKSSYNTSKFMIMNISMVEDITSSLRFNIKDSHNTQWTVDVNPTSSSDGTIASFVVDQKVPNGDCTTWILVPPYGLDLTDCYINAGITVPNVLSVEKIHSDILHVTFLIN